MGALSRLEHLESFVDALCLDRFVLVGASQGAWIAARYAVDHPQRLSGLVLSASRALCIAVGLQVADPTPVFEGSEAGMRRTLEKAIFRQQYISDELVAHCLHVATRPGMERARAVHAEGQKRLAHDPQFHARHDLSTALPQLDVPTLCVWGRADRSAEASMGEALRQLMPRAEFHFLEDAAHQIFRDQPDKVATIIDTWRATNFGSSAGQT